MHPLQIEAIRFFIGRALCCAPAWCRAESRRQDVSHFTRDGVLHREDICRIFFALICFFDLTAGNVPKLSADTDFPAFQLIVRRENVVSFLLPPGGEGLLPDVDICASGSM